MRADEHEAQLAANSAEHERCLNEKDARLHEKDAEVRRLQEAVAEARRLQQDAGANEARSVAEIETHTYDGQIDKGGIDLKTKGTGDAAPQARLRVAADGKVALCGNGACGEPSQELDVKGSVLASGHVTAARGVRTNGTVEAARVTAGIMNATVELSAPSVRSR